MLVQGGTVCLLGGFKNVKIMRLLKSTKPVRKKSKLKRSRTEKQRDSPRLRTRDNRSERPRERKLKISVGNNRKRCKRRLKKTT